MEEVLGSDRPGKTFVQKLGSRESIERPDVEEERPED